MRFKRRLLPALAMAVLASGAAQANVLQLRDVTAAWFDDVPSVTINNANPLEPTARWGTPSGQPNQSGYNFNVASLPIVFNVPTSPSDINSLGMFTHLNYPITGTSLQSIKLRITADVWVKGVSDADFTQVGTDLEFIYGFAHWETLNRPRSGICANGAANGSGVNKNGCADRVIAYWDTSSEDFLINSEKYSLDVFGFSLDMTGTAPFTEFWTKENESNVAYLLGQVRLLSEIIEPPPPPPPPPPPEGENVPEPGTLALLGLGLAGLAATRRRKQ